MSAANIEQVGSAPNTTNLNCTNLNCTTINNIPYVPFNAVPFSNVSASMGNYTTGVAYVNTLNLNVGTYQFNAIVQATMSVAPGGSPPVVVIPQVVMSATGTAVFAPNTPFGTGSIIIADSAAQTVNSQLSNLVLSAILSCTTAGTFTFTLSPTATTASTSNFFTFLSYSLSQI